MELNKIFKLHEVTPRWQFFPRAIAITFATFLVCAAIDLLRQRLVEPVFAWLACKVVGSKIVARLKAVGE